MLSRASYWEIDSAVGLVSVDFVNLHYEWRNSLSYFFTIERPSRLNNGMMSEINVRRSDLLHFQRQKIENERSGTQELMWVRRSTRN